MNRIVSLSLPCVIVARIRRGQFAPSIQEIPGCDPDWLAALPSVAAWWPAAIDLWHMSTARRLAAEAAIVAQIGGPIPPDIRRELEVAGRLPIVCTPGAPCVLRGIRLEVRVLHPWQDRRDPCEGADGLVWPAAANGPWEVFLPGRAIATLPRAARLTGAPAALRDARFRAADSAAARRARCAREAQLEARAARLEKASIRAQLGLGGT